MDKTLTYYLAGPMTGLPQFNIPAFYQMTTRLRGQGYKIVSPAELDDPEVLRASLASPDGAVVDGIHPTGHSWGDFLSRDVKLIADGVEGILLLPNWRESRGARLEVFVGLLCGHVLYEYDTSLKSFMSLSNHKAANAVVEEFTSTWIRQYSGAIPC